MNVLRSKYTIAILVLLVSGILFIVYFTRNPVSYSHDVKPILNQKCISCHGGVKKKGGFSLLFRDEALSPTASGKPAIIPGDAAASDMIRRLSHTDPEERMPYHEAPLSETEIDVLTRWVDEGAKFETHWSYLPVEKPVVPGYGFFSFFIQKPKNEIDRFIDKELRENGLERSEEAEKRTLLRRVSLDLIGIPAPDSIANAYLSNSESDAFEKLVDQLLASPFYGERWTAMWMDLARYADTKGYERDYIRSIWRYRDWLIKAFNQDKPYDQFLTEQLAGDLMPDPSDEQLIATAFHRNTMTNDEGGTDNEEFRVAATIDRVNTTWETLLGTSFACVQCHSHPYDPFRHEDYYRFMAYFNNSRDEDTYDEYPLLKEFRNNSALQYDSLKKWISTNVGNTEHQKFLIQLLKTGHAAVNSIQADSLVNAALEDTKFLRFRKNAIARFRQMNFNGFPSLLIRFRSPVEKGVLSIHPDDPTNSSIATAAISQTKGGWQIVEIPVSKDFKGTHDLYFKFSSPLLKDENDNGMVIDWFVATPELTANNSMEQTYYRKMFLQLLNNPDAEKTPIMQDNPPYMKRKTYVFERGNWLLKTKEVDPGLPEVLVGQAASYTKNRMGLAMWMTDKKNPLTARTMVNRLWEQLFGQGLVETLEDLGSQGAAPTHKELLDFLAYNFMNEDQWSIKKLLKRVVMSETYRQSSVVSKEAMEKDPLNKLYARAPRVRLSAEQIRDQALAVCETLSKKMYGPSVMPYQPDGIWKSPYDERKWIQSEGEDQYRRSIYTYWKRTSPYPSMVNFDGTAREVCLTRRIRTNTPLQALTILNDSTYWDLSVKLARLASTNHPSDIKQQIGKTYEKVTGQPVTPQKIMVLENLYQKGFKQLGSDQTRINKMLSDSILHKEDRHLAAMAMVTNAILNLDEVITKN
jgi:hypothetical protein